MTAQRHVHQFPDGTLGAAIISEDGLFRYMLSRIWDGSKPIALVLMLNPSKATHKNKDNTITKITSFGRSFGWGGFMVGNLSAYRATDPKDLKAAGFPIGPENDFYLEQAIRNSSGPIVCAWGANPRAMNQLDRVTQVLALIRSRDRQPKAWRLGTRGDPWHPLYLSANTQLVEMPSA